MKDKKPQENSLVRVYDAYTDTWYEGKVVHLLSSMFTYALDEEGYDTRMAFYRDKWEEIK